MIDLHMHTQYSDGALSVKNLLMKLEKNGVEYASITDHNSVGAHVELATSDYSNLYHGHILTGVELQVIFQNKIVEVLVYDFQLEKFKPFVEELNKKFWNFHHEAYLELLNRAEDLGLSYKETDKPIQNGYYANMKFQEAIVACQEENKGKLDERFFTDHLYFYRSEFQNPDSIFYIDSTQAFLPVEEVIEFAHQCDGLVFLAHIDEYQAIPDKTSYLNAIISQTNLDGIEVYHPSISDEHTNFYIELAKRNKILMSAGSDFHGTPMLTHRKDINTKAKLEQIDWLQERLKFQKLK